MKYRFTKDEINVKQNPDGSFVLSIILNGQYIDRVYVFYHLNEALTKFQHEFGVYPNDFKPAGVLPLSNHGALAIMEIENGIEDYAIVTDNYGDGYKNIGKHLIKYNMKNEPYFMRNNKRYYLHNFMRV